MVDRRGRCPGAVGHPRRGAVFLPGAGHPADQGHRDGPPGAEPCRGAAGAGHRGAAAAGRPADR
ncbi:hypothetical protein ACFFX0_06155 [Citricoccus parietis]|uniref:Uncharacterized protein n=1 Tax=Citricoccus parietis TaxID=592307 RepID=A0ABV5FVU1_9MICC